MLHIRVDFFEFKTKFKKKLSLNIVKGSSGRHHFLGAKTMGSNPGKEIQSV